MAQTTAVDWEALKRQLVAAPPATADDQTLLRDGRRLDSKERVLAWLVEIGHLTPEEAAGF